MSKITILTVVVRLMGALATTSFIIAEVVIIAGSYRDYGIVGGAIAMLIAALVNAWLLSAWKDRLTGKDKPNADRQ